MKRFFASAFLSVLATAAALAVDPSRYSAVYFAAGNSDVSSTLFGYGADFSSTGAALSLNSSKSWSGLSGAGEPSTMTFAGIATAQSDYGRLRTSVDARLSDVFYNPGNPYYYDGTPDTNPNDEGVADTFLATGTVGFTDRLAFGGGAFTGYKARYVFHVDGYATGTNVAANLRCSIAGNPFEQLDVDLTSGFVDQDWTTDAYSVGASFEQTADVRFTTRFDANAWDELEGGTVAGSAIFSSTITLSAVLLYDTHGKLVSNYTVSGASGTAYPVPEPASLAALGVGAAAFFRRSRPFGPARGKPPLS